MTRTIQTIPDGWSVKKLGELGVFSKGVGITKNDLVNEGVPCVRYAEIYTKFDFYINNCISFIPLEIAKTAKPIEFGDILFAGSGETKEEIGKCAVYNNKTLAYVGGDTIIFKTKNNQPIFFSYYLNTLGRRQLNPLGQGDSIVHIRTKDLEKVYVPIPPLPEQEKIAEVLSCWDEGIEKLSALIEEKKIQKKGLMQKLLSGKHRLKGFSQPWETVELGELLDYEQPTKYLVDDYIDYDQSLISVLTANKTFILGSTTDTKGIYNKGNCIIFDDFTTDKKYVDFPFKVKSSAIKILTPKKDMNLKIIFELMSLIRYPLGGHKRYYLSEYQFVPITIPADLSEQKAIADILSKADEEIELLNQKLDALKEQKKGLMQQLLTGKIRVKVN